MKIRNGLVSNSSSSSYMVVGFPVGKHSDESRETDKLYEAIFGIPFQPEDEYDSIWDQLINGKDGIAVVDSETVGKKLVGYVFSDSDSDYYHQEIHILSFLDMIPKLYELRAKLGLTETVEVSVFRFKEYC